MITQLDNINIGDGKLYDVQVNENGRKRTLEQLCDEALFVQDGCNLIAIANSFGKAMMRLRQLLNLDANALNNHAITVLWVSKIASMNNHFEDFSEAYSFAEKVSKKELRPLTIGDVVVVNDKCEFKDLIGKSGKITQLYNPKSFVSPMAEVMLDTGSTALNLESIQHV